jgi:hypothetical protein
MLIYRVCCVSNRKGLMPCFISFDVRSHYVNLFASNAFSRSIGIFSYFVCWACACALLICHVCHYSSLISATELEPLMACLFIHVPRKRLQMSMHGCRNTGNAVVVFSNLACKGPISCFMIFDVRLHFARLFASCICGGHVDVYHLTGSVPCCFTVLLCTCSRPVLNRG